mgnify:CR=1 FL=1
MKIIKPSVEFLGEIPTDYAGTLAFIEKAGRTCYKSEDKIGCSIKDPQEFTPDYCAEEGRWDDMNGGDVNCDAGCKYHSAQKFVKKLIKSEHLAMVENSNFVVGMVGGILLDFLALQGELGKYLTVHLANGELHIGGSLTAWINRYNEYVDDEQPMDDGLFTPFFETYGELFGRGNEGHDTGWEVCPHDEIPKALHRYSAKFICDRGVSHELVRHRPCSFAQESTRYVNYGGKDMEFIEPAGFEEWKEESQLYFENLCASSEMSYDRMLGHGLKPQQARAILPNALKTEIIVTADAAEWDHIHKLRTHPSAHPDMVRVMNMLPWDKII